MPAECEHTISVADDRVAGQALMSRLAESAACRGFTSRRAPELGIHECQVRMQGRHLLLQELRHSHVQRGGLLMAGWHQQPVALAAAPLGKIILSELQAPASMTACSWACRAGPDQ